MSKEQRALVFGRQRKIEFDARNPDEKRAAEVFRNPSAYSYVHNYKVHYKRGAFQALANKLDISVGGPSPSLPESQVVVDEFNRRMTAAVFSSDTRERYSSASYHITNVEYKESMAIPLPNYQVPSGTALTVQSQQQLESSLSCSDCGAKLPSGSKFCNNCGKPAA